MCAAVRRVRRRRRSDPLFQKRPKKKPVAEGPSKTVAEEKWEGPDDILLWEEFYDTVVRDPVTAADFLSPLMFEDEKAALHKHTQEWLTRHLQKWPEHKELVQKLAGRLSVVVNHGDGIDDKTYKALAAAQGNACELYNLGVAYECGKHGFPADIQKAIFYYNEAGKRGETWSLCNLGCIYLRGMHGVPKNESLGLGYLMKGAEDPCCQTKIAGYYQEVHKKLDWATEWYEKAVAQGNHTAKFHLALALKETDRPRCILLIRDFLAHRDELEADEVPTNLPRLETDTSAWDPYIRLAQQLVEE